MSSVPAVIDSAQVIALAPRIPLFGEVATVLAALGYLPVPIIRGQKRPAIDGWQNYRFAPADASRFANAYAGLLTGHGCVALDVDIYDESRAEAVEKLARQCLGKAPVRVGRWPKRVLLYRFDGDIQKRRAVLGTFGGHDEAVELLGTGQQVVAFGMHPETGKPYEWTTEATPLNVPCEDLTVIETRHLDAFFRAVSAMFPEARASKPAPDLHAPADARWSGLVENILEGNGLHDSIRDLSAGLVSSGMPGGAVVQTLRAIVGQSAARLSTPDRWRERFEDIPRAVSTAQAAFTALDARAIPEGGGELKRERLRPKSLLEVMAKPVPSWLVRDLVPDRGLGVIYGPPNSGKSFSVLDLSMSVARGVEFFGRRTKRRGVVYIAAEGNLSGRLAAYLKHHDLRAEDLADAIRIVDGSLNMRDPMADLPEFLEEIARARDEMGGIGLVVVDTLNRVMSGGKENSDEDMGAVIAACRRLEDVTGGLVLLIHHSGKNPELGARGHSSLLAAADVEFKVEGTEGPRTLSVTKQRDGSTDQSFVFSLDVVDLGPRSAVDPDADDDERITSCVVVPCDPALIAPKKRNGPTGKNKRAVFSALRELVSEQGQLLPETSAIPPGARGVRVDMLIARARHALVAVDDKRKTERIMEAVNSLRDDGFVGIADPWVWPC